MSSADLTYGCPSMRGIQRTAATRRGSRGSAPSSSGASSATPARVPAANAGCVERAERRHLPHADEPVVVSSTTIVESVPSSALPPRQMYGPSRNGCSWRYAATRAMRMLQGYRRAHRLTWPRTPPRIGAMRITAVRATPVNIPFHAPYRFSLGSTASVTKTIVEVETDEGVTGIGECADGDRSAEVAAPRRAAGRPRPARPQRVRAALRAGVRALAVGERDDAASARSGRSRWRSGTLRGRAEDKPLHVLLGGAVRREIAFTEYFALRHPGRRRTRASRRRSRSRATAPA